MPLADAPSAALPAFVAASAAPIGAGRLALAFQEVLTAVARLRAGRQPITDAAAFRAHVTGLLGRADGDARAAGYAAEEARLAVFAVVALLDESALNAPQPALAAWARRPLQEELFGGHMAGEWFFQHVDRLLAAPDAPALADLLELHQLCLLLGFRGRYGAGDPAALDAIAARIGERVARIRGGTGAVGVAPGELVAGWRPPDDAVVRRDPWIRRLTIGLAAAALVAVAIWGAGAVALRGAEGDLAALGTPAAPAPGR